MTEQPTSPFSIRRHLQKTPKLGDIIADGFDYEGFKKAIRESDGLNDQEKHNACKMFNPAKSIKLPWMRSERDHRREYKKHLPEHIGFGHPFYAQWEDVWLSVREHYASQLEAYTKDYDDRHKSPILNWPPHVGYRYVNVEDNPYPNYLPPIYVQTFPEGSKYKGVSAQMHLPVPGEHSAALIVSKEFLSLLPEEQRQILIHECNHLFEPVIDGMQLEEWWKKKSDKPKDPLKVDGRRGEYRADALVKEIGDPEIMAALMIQRENELKDQSKLPVILRAAMAHGLSLEMDRKVTDPELAKALNK